MKAAVLYGNRDMRVEEVPDPTPKEDEVMIKVSRNGICGTDLHEYLEGPIFATKGIIMGHEFSGTVAEVGSKVTDFKVGDRVVAVPFFYCGTCYYCKRGLYHLCNNLLSMGLWGINGALASYVVVNAKQVFLMPDNLPLEEGALVETIAVAFHGVRRSRLKAGESILITGAGPIGSSAILSAKAAGASQIIVSEVSQRRKELAKDLGATTVLDPTKDDVVAVVKELTKGVGVDVSLEAAGANQAFEAAIQSLRKRGRFVQVAENATVSGIVWNQYLLSEIELLTSFGYEFMDEFPAVMSLMAKGAIEGKKIVTDDIKLDRVVEDGFEALAKERDKHNKILVNPDI